MPELPPLTTLPALPARVQKSHGHNYIEYGELRVQKAMSVCTLGYVCNHIASFSQDNEESASR